MIGVTFKHNGGELHVDLHAESLLVDDIERGAAQCGASADDVAQWFANIVSKADGDWHIAFTIAFRYDTVEQNRPYSEIGVRTVASALHLLCDVYNEVRSEIAP